MRNKKFTAPFSLLCLGLLGSAGVIPASVAGQAPPPAAPAGPPPAAAAGGKLTLVEGKGIERKDPSSGTVNCGDIDPLLEPHIERTFTFRNDTKQPLTITRLQTSCGCESTAFLRDGKEQLRPEQQPAALAPGEEAQVRLSVTLTGRHSYIKHASLWIYGQEAASPLAYVEMVVQIEPTVTLEPQVLQFNKSIAGSSPSQTFTAAFDPRILAAGKTWKISTSNPAITAAQEPGEKQEKRGEKTVIVRTYRATLAPTTPIGRLSGAIIFTLEDAAAPVKAGSLPITLSLPVLGERSGTFDVSPATLFYGSVTAGRENKRILLLSAAAIKDLEEAKVTSDNPLITVKRNAPEILPRNGAGQRLEVVLSEKIAAGALSAHITVEAKNGEKLIVPVIAQIEKAAVP